MNYIGSKLSIIDFIKNTILEVVGDKNTSNYIFADLFAGTGIVGSSFKEIGCSVIANDIQYYSYVLNKHLIENNEELNKDLLNYLDNLEEKEGFIFNNYALGSGSNRNYFSDYNAKKCDAIRIELEVLYKNKKISEAEYFYYLSSLLNSIDKHANTASVYGAFLKKLKRSALNNFKLELLPIIKNNSKNYVYNEDINSLVTKISGDILYLDPPYNARQYCSNYHLLETIAKYDEPNIFGKTGLRDYSTQKSQFCSKRNVLKTFDELLKNSKFKYIFLSYNNEGLMSLENISEIMKKYGNYSLFKTEHRRFKADKEKNRNYKASHTFEYLHCLIK